MAQAINLDSISTSSVSPDFLVKNSEIMSEIKRDIQDNNPDANKTRRGKKNELMPADTKVVNLQQPTNIKNAGDDSVNGTSIWFLLADFYVNNLMQTNQLEMSADAVALQANQKAMDLVQQGYSQLNDKLDTKTTQNAKKAHHFLLGTRWGGIAALAIGLVVLAIVLAPMTGGLSLGMALAAAPGIAALGTLLVAGGAAIAIAGKATYDADKNNPGSVAMISSMIDNSIDDPALLQKNQALASSLSSLASSANNDTSKSTQDLQNVNSLEQQYSSMFSQMMNYYNTSVRGG